VDRVTNKGYDSRNNKIVHGERLGPEICRGLPVVESVCAVRGFDVFPIWDAGR